MTESKFSIRLIAAPPGTFLKDPSLPVPEQVRGFREALFETFLLKSEVEMPPTIYSRMLTPDKVDAVCFGLVGDPGDIPDVVESMLMDGAQWVCHIAEAFYHRTSEDGTPLGEKAEVVAFVTYGQDGWFEMALHGFSRATNDFPLPMGEWIIHKQDGNLRIGGSCAPFQDREKGN